MKCFKCGTLIENDTETCPNCGQNLKKIKKGFSPNLYNKIKPLSSNKSQKSIPMDISIGDSISEQYIIHEYLNDDLIFYSFIGIDSFNKQKVQIDFVKPTLLKTEYDKSQFINSLREEKFRQHENLTIIYDYGKHNNYYYIVSEHIEGISLREIIDSKQENFTLEEVEPIITQITDALTDIHEDSLVGYLIPENIIIMKNILKIRNTFWFRCFNHKTVLKYFSSDAPSYHYLAPELRGGSPKLINATDLYSIGVILSSLLVGKIYKGVPFNLTEYNRDLPFEIDMLFLKLVNKNANKRFQNVEDFLISFDKLFSFTPIDHDETTRVVNTSDILSIEEDEENFDFEDEMETSMIDRTHAQNVVTKFDDDEPETKVLPKNKKVQEAFEEDEHETKMMPKKKKKPIKTQNNKKESPKGSTTTPKKEEEKKKKDSNTSFNSYKNPFYQPEEIKKEQEHFQQQKEFQEYQKSVYQQLSDFQERDNKKNLLMIVGFFAFALIIIVLILVMFLKPNNTISSNDTKLMATIKKQNEMIEKMNKKFENLEKQKQKSKEEVLVAKKERENKEKELIEQDKKIKALNAKKLEKPNEEEQKKLEEEKKNAQLQKEKLKKELEAKKKAEEEKKKKEKELKAKFKKEQEIIAKKRKEAQNKKAQQTKLIKNKKLSMKLEAAKKKEALKLAQKKEAKRLAQKKEKERLAKKKEEEKLAKEKSKKKKDLDAEADALLASAMNENKEEAAVKKDGRCPRGMIKIKAGSFKYGSPASDPTRGPSDPLLKTVNLNTYCIDRYESKGPSSFTQSEARCKKRGKRICTTQEWEKACKGKYNRKFPYGNKFNADKCNTADADGEARKYKRTGSFKKCRSPYGLYDMSGNLAEWTKNGNSSRQILKGGSYKSEDFDAKCSSVKKASKGSRKAIYGYRCCSNLE